VHSGVYSGPALYNSRYTVHEHRPALSNYVTPHRSHPTKNPRSPSLQPQLEAYPASNVFPLQQPPGESISTPLPRPAHGFQHWFSTPRRRPRLATLSQRYALSRRASLFSNSSEDSDEADNHTAAAINDTRHPTPRLWCAWSDISEDEGDELAQASQGNSLIWLSSPTPSSTGSQAVFTDDEEDVNPLGEYIIPDRFEFVDPNDPPIDQSLFEDFSGDYTDLFEACDQVFEQDVDPLAPRYGPGISTPSYESLMDYYFE
jgi:hypothetical protein